MIKIGMCNDKVENIRLLADAGFEYIELPLVRLEAMTDEEFDAVRKAYADAPIHPEVANCMLPGDIKVTGPDVDYSGITSYLEKAFHRAVQMGIHTVVFGSGGSRRVVAGWSHEKAYEQLRTYLTIVNTYCEKYDVTVAIEPLSREETNIINFVSEAALFSKFLGFPRIGALGDTFHMIQNHEPFCEFAYAGRLLKHVHIAHSNGSKDRNDPNRRNYPAMNDGVDYCEVFAHLKAIGYDAHVSIEADCQNMAKEAPAAFKALDFARRSAL